jgi:hypothetical protein
VVVLTVEEEGRSLPGEVRFEGRGLAVELGGQLRIAGFLDQLQGGKEVVRARFETAPQFDLGSEAAGLAEDLLSSALVVPESGLRRLRL